MLKRIEIINFQSHKNSELDLVPGMNVITGSSDSGKSGILRALLLALTNKPSGDAYKSWFSKEDANVSVSLEFDDFWFTRNRKKGKNSYETENGEFVALKQDVPEEISLQANITDYNIQTQFQKYFLLQDSPGDRAKRLNELVGLEIIDNMYKKFNSMVYNIKQEIKFLTSKLTTVQEEIENLDFLDAADVLINKISTNIDTQIKTEGKCNRLQETLSVLIEITTKQLNLEKVLKQESAIQSINRKIQILQEKESQYGRLQEFSEMLEEITTAIQDDKEWLAVDELYKALEQKVQTVSDKKSDAYLLEKHSISLNTVIASEIHWKSELHSKTQTYVALLKDVGMCPTCYNKLDSKSISIISKKLLEGTE